MDVRITASIILTLTPLTLTSTLLDSSAHPDRAIQSLVHLPVATKIKYGKYVVAYELTFFLNKVGAKGAIKIP